MALRYENGVLIPTNTGAPLSAAAKEILTEEIFITILRRLFEEGRFVSNKSGTNYAPAIFALEPEATGPMVSKTALKAAMIRLFVKRRIKIEPYGPPSRGAIRLTEAPL